MESFRRAVIDVGTNSVKLLVADTKGECVTPLTEKSLQTRLGSGFYQTCRLRPDSIEKTAQAVANFVREAGHWNPERIRVIATSAARDALNRSELLVAIEESSGLGAQVITGEQEADWVFRGVTTDSSLWDRTLMILDVGGGSAEFILGKGTTQYFRASFHLGTVRLLERLQLSDPPSKNDWNDCHNRILEFIEKEIRPAVGPQLQSHSSSPVQFIGTGGTATILGRMQLQMESFDRPALEALLLTQADVFHHRELLWKLPLEERRCITGLPPSRADVILAGSAIISTVMEHFEFPTLRVSTRGLRFAAILDER